MLNNEITRNIDNSLFDNKLSIIIMMYYYGKLSAVYGELVVGIRLYDIEGCHEFRIQKEDTYSFNNNFCTIGIVYYSPIHQHFYL